MHLCSLFAVVVLLAGCTASWRAPVENRGHPPVKRSTAGSATTVRPATRPGPVLRRPLANGEYCVRPGDTLHGIAWQTGIDHRSIAHWNGLRPPYRIYAGQTLQLKPPATRRMPPPPPTRAERPKTRAKPQPPRPTKPGQPAEAAKRLAWSWPVKGQLVSSFKSSDPLRSGIKIAGTAGTQIHSAEAGKVVYSGSGLIGYGRLIIVKHNDKYLSAYGHNRKLLVAEGDQVAKGQKIAEMGTANNGDALLHFEIRRDGKPVDPMRLLPRR